MWSRNSSWLGAGPSKTLVDATCMWAPARSMWRKEESSPVNLSPFTRKSSHRTPRVLRSDCEQSGADAELELRIGVLGDHRILGAVSEPGHPDAEQAHRALGVVGAQQ